MLRSGRAARSPIKVGGGVPVEPGEFVPFIFGEAALMQEIECIVPLMAGAEIQETQAEVMGNVGEVMFRVRCHA